jgi:hypothetical protein
VLLFALVMLTVIALVSAASLIAVVVGMRQEHPTDLALRGPTRLAVLTRLVLGLYVRRAETVQHADSTVGAGQPGATNSMDAREAQ